MTDNYSAVARMSEAKSGIDLDGSTIIPGLRYAPSGLRLLESDVGFFFAILFIVACGCRAMSVQLISTLLLGSTNPDHYSMTDGVVRSDKNIPLQVALDMAEQDPIWGHRGRAIQSYAILEQALSGALAEFGGMTRENATTIFYKITNTGSRSKILQKLLRRKFGTTYNLFWNVYFKELTRIDLRRSEIVHWLSAMNVALNTHNMIDYGRHPGRP
jgi:hypothetical protein